MTFDHVRVCVCVRVRVRAVKGHTIMHKGGEPGNEATLLSCWWFSDVVTDTSPPTQVVGLGNCRRLSLLPVTLLMCCILKIVHG